MANRRELEDIQSELGIGAPEKIGIGVVAVVVVAAGAAYWFAHELGKTSE